MNGTSFSLKGKKILITGASSGIGRSCAVIASKLGAEVILTSRRKEQLKATLDLLEGSGHQIILADLRNPSDRECLVQDLPELDGVVFCAGKIDPFPVKFLSEEKIMDLMQLNFYSTALLSANLLRQKKLKEYSSLVYLSSFGAHHTYKGGAIYASSKLAIEGFSKVIAQENKALKIRTNCIAPAMVETEVYTEATRQISEEAMAKHTELYPLGIGQPEDVANTAAFLLSPASRWMTGQTIFLDGGLSLNL